MDLETLTETKHEELMLLINPLVDFMAENNYSFFLVAGKEGTCTRHLRGNYNDVHGMILGLMRSKKQVEGLVTDIVNDFNSDEK